MAAPSLEATVSSISFFSHTSLPSPFSLSFPSKFPLSTKPSSSTIRLRISLYTLPLPLKSPLCPSTPPSIRPTFELGFSVEGVALEENPKDTREENNQKRKLYVVNLPFSFSSDNLKNAFSECGTVKEVEIIKNKDGKKRGFAFVTMATGDEAQAVVDRFHSKELSGRTIKVEFARRLRKPRPQPLAVPPVKDKETRHKLYVSNLQWKVRSTHLREFFSANFNPVSARVIFESPSGRSAGYGFVSFSTREEAEAALSSLDGKELLGRPVSLKFSERNSEGEDGNEEEEKDGSDESVSRLGKEEVLEEQSDKS